MFLTRPWKALFVTTDDDIREWWFRWRLDRYRWDFAHRGIRLQCPSVEGCVVGTSAHLWPWLMVTFVWKVLFIPSSGSTYVRVTRDLVFPGVTYTHFNADFCGKVNFVFLSWCRALSPQFSCAFGKTCFTPSNAEKVHGCQAAKEKKDNSQRQRKAEIYGLLCMYFF